MKFHSHAQEEAYRKALQHPFKAVAFDVDGTLTHFSRFIIPKTLAEALVKIPPEIPRAICTGRDIQFIHSQLEHICSHAEDPLKERTRWFVFAENGGAAYHWNPRKKNYERFFNVPWPKTVTKETMESAIQKRLGRRVVVSIREHTLVVRNPSWSYLFPRFTRILSKHNHGRIETLFKKLGWDKDFLIQDSGIGNVVLSKKSGKGNAMKRWAKLMGVHARDILVVGDQPKRGENDEDFLCGRNGTPFSVGGLTDSMYPLPVLGGRHEQLKGPEGTEALVKQVRWEEI